MIKIAIILCLSRTVITAFDYRATPPALLFPFCQAVNENSLPDSISNPAYLPRIQYPYLHCSGSRPYTLDGLYSTTLRAGYAIQGFAMQAVWNRFGIDQYLENIAEVNLAYMPVRYISIGTGVSYYNLSINTTEALLTTHQADCRASILITPFQWIEVAFQHENIVSLFIKKRRDLMFPEWSAGAALKPFKGFALLYNINKTSNGYVNTIAASANVLRYFSIRVGYAREATTYSSAVSFIYKYISVSYGLKYHPHLGFTHSAGVTLSTSDMNIDSLGYGSIFSRAQDPQNTRAININSCSMDQLTAIPGLQQHTAERIMKYRKTIGPLSRNSLLNVGMTEKEIDNLLKHITGLTPDDSAQKSDIRIRARYERAQKELFRKLVGIGIPAATALELTDMALKEQKQRYMDKVNSLPDLDPDKKKQVLELCAGSL